MQCSFRINTSDPEQFQELISPLSGPCRVRPAKGTHFDINLRAAKLEKLALFTVKAPSVKVHIPALQDHFGLDIPLGKPFSTTESNRRHRFSDDIHLLMPDREMNLDALYKCRVMAIKLNSQQVYDFAFKLSGTRKPFKSASVFRLPRSTVPYVALIQSIAMLWSYIQRGDPLLSSPINQAESEDAILTHFILAMRKMSIIAKGYR